MDEMENTFNKATFWTLIRAEMKKIFFLTFSKKYLFALVVFSLGLGLIFSLTTDVTQGRDVTELSPMDVISASMLGVDLTNVMFIVFTAWSLSNELSTKFIHVSLAVTPNRRRFFLTKWMAYFLLSVGISLVTVLLTSLAGQLVLIAHNQPMVPVLDPSFLQLVTGLMIMPVFYGVLTAAAAFIFMNSGKAMVFSLGVMAVPALIKMFSAPIQQIFLPLFPQSAIHSLAGIVERSSFESVGVAFAIFLLLLWIILTIIMALVRFQRKDF